MRKRILLVAILLISFLAYSQSFEIGGRAGISIAKLKYSSFSTENLARPILAFTMERNLSKRWSLEGALGYSGKGGGNFDPGDKLFVGVDDFKTKLDYLNCSLLLRYYLGNDHNLKPFFTLGPSLSYAIFAKQLGLDIKDDLRSEWDISSMFGLGLKYNFDGSLFIELLGGIDRGWSKIIRAQNESLFNHSIWISIGVKKSL